MELAYLVGWTIIFAVWLTREWMFIAERREWAVERADLLDRIQARDLREYRHARYLDELRGRRPRVISPSLRREEVARTDGSSD